MRNLVIIGMLGSQKSEAIGCSTRAVNGLMLLANMLSQGGKIDTEVRILACKVLREIDRVECQSGKEIADRFLKVLIEGIADGVEYDEKQITRTCL